MERTLAALVIGNSAYHHAKKLPNPVNDAVDMTTKLETLGFRVTLLTDATKQVMETAIHDFRSGIAVNSVGLVFFAGHAFQIDGKNYLAAVDTDPQSEVKAKWTSVDLDLVLDVLKYAAARTGFVILDACRDNPFRGLSRSGTSDELATVYAPKGTLVAFSTSPGQTADDGSGRNGTYTQALLHHIGTPNLPVETMFKRVRSELEGLTSGRQTSWEHTSLVGDFRFQLTTKPELHGYGGLAIEDGLFPQNTSVISTVIEALKTYNWYKQNPALDGFSIATAANCSADELFVFGRNIYQAACGYANATDRYLADFSKVTQTLAPLKRKAILDGMLYEVFFDSAGQRRTNPKVARFNELFKLQSDANLASSFAFIQGCLAPFRHLYLELPGSGNIVDLSIRTVASGQNDTHTITAVWRDSINLLNPRATQEEAGWFASRDRTFSFTEFREYISETLVIPQQQLTIEFDCPYSKTTTFVLPATLELLGLSGTPTQV